jgi:predicted DCC family thiol-disulfide oxidoreductase YuxK
VNRVGQRSRPLLIYDGDCGFCRRWIERWRETTAGRIDYASSQQVGGQFPDISPERFEQSVIFVETDGSVYDGAEAVFRSLSHAPGGGRALAAYRRLPGFAPASELAYRVVASNRRLASLGTRLLWGGETRSSRYQLTRWLFLRGLGLIYLIAFLSLWVQLDGLFGSQGILPAGPWIRAVFKRYGFSAIFDAPTVFLLTGASDRMLHTVCGAGVAASVLLIVNAIPALAAIAAWGLYLSLYSVGRTFLSFQWDILLLETGFLAILLAPWQILPHFVDRKPVPRIVVWLLRWLLFRLMFLSGAVKLLSGDPVWKNLTALTYHYWTQPLPSWTSWYAALLPLWVQKASCAVMFVIELAVPFLVFLPRRPRLLAFGSFVLLQVMIMATGNYGFFNLLTLVLCIPLLDDAYLCRVVPAFMRPPRPDADRPVARRANGGRLPAFLRGAVAAVLVFLSGVQFVSRVGWYDYVPWQVRLGMDGISAFHLTSSYGLFAVMTKQRPEIILEGSDDAQTWKPYGFKWKPGDLDRPPAFVEPYMPRVDWQMWFAALGSYRRQGWLVAMMRRMLEGSQPVLGLLGDNPFPHAPPRYLRATVWQYRFTDPETRRSTGAWWTRSDPRPYMPIMQRKDH